MVVGDELITLKDFCNRYGVDSAVVRLWIRQKQIPYTLVGPKHIKMIRPTDVIKPYGGADARRSDASDEGKPSDGDAKRHEKNPGLPPKDTAK